MNINKKNIDKKKFDEICNSGEPLREQIRNTFNSFKGHPASQVIALFDFTTDVLRALKSDDPEFPQAQQEIIKRLNDIMSSVVVSACQKITYH